MAILDGTQFPMLLVQDNSVSFVMLFIDDSTIPGNQHADVQDMVPFVISLIEESIHNL